MGDLVASDEELVWLLSGLVLDDACVEEVLFGRRPACGGVLPTAAVLPAAALALALFQLWRRRGSPDGLLPGSLTELDLRGVLEGCKDDCGRRLHLLHPRAAENRGHADPAALRLSDDVLEELVCAQVVVREVVQDLLPDLLRRPLGLGREVDVAADLHVDGQWPAAVRPLEHLEADLVPQFGARGVLLLGDHGLLAVLLRDLPGLDEHVARLLSDLVDQAEEGVGIALAFALALGRRPRRRGRRGRWGRRSSLLEPCVLSHGYLHLPLSIERGKLGLHKPSRLGLFLRRHALACLAILRHHGHLLVVAGDGLLLGHGFSRAGATGTGMARAVVARRP
mmetsp:Transcript_119274/g.362875  ORF Transcript_119274/g.362875 Transcript_119274/m.362875 type:complete len:338 (+) Transcript_119274:329-1342(+)